MEDTSLPLIWKLPVSRNPLPLWRISTIKSYKRGLFMEAQQGILFCIHDRNKLQGPSGNRHRSCASAPVWSARLTLHLSSPPVWSTSDTHHLHTHFTAAPILTCLFLIRLSLIMIPSPHFLKCICTIHYKTLAMKNERCSHHFHM